MTKPEKKEEQKILPKDKDKTEKLLEEKGEDYDWDPKYRVVLHGMDDMAYEFCEAVLDWNVKKIWIEYVGDWMDNEEDYIIEKLD